MNDIERVAIILEGASLYAKCVFLSNYVASNLKANIAVIKMRDEAKTKWKNWFLSHDVRITSEALKIVQHVTDTTKEMV